MKTSKNILIPGLIAILVTLSLSTGNLACSVSSTQQNVQTPSPGKEATISVKVIPMQAVTPAIYLQMPNLDITFVDYEISNNGSKAARLIVESELQGYSEKAVNTVDIAPHTTVTVGQTPKLKSEAIPREIANTTLHYRI